MITTRLRSQTMSSSTLSLQQIWLKGCKGETLSQADEAHFQSLARSRFHTFSLSADQAGETRSHQEAKDWVRLLVKGLVKELRANPGLERAWQTSDFVQTSHGRSVSFNLSQHDG